MLLTFTTLNVQAVTDWDTRKPAIIDYITSVDADFVLFQEVTFLPQIMATNQTTIINQTVEYPYEASAVTRLQASIHYENYREGLGVLSKWPIRKSEAIILKQQAHDEHQRIVQLVDVEIDNRIVKFANLHFSISDTDEDLPREHLKELLEILRSRGESRILGGDFNMNDIMLHADLWEEDYLSTAPEKYISYPHMNKRVDYFLIPKKDTFKSVATSGDDLSDHRALTVTIDVVNV